MKPRLTHQTRQETEATHHHEARGELEFETVEALLRHDAAQTPLPPEIARRLEAELAATPPARAPWWRRLFQR